LVKPRKPKVVSLVIAVTLWAELVEWQLICRFERDLVESDFELDLAAVTGCTSVTCDA